MELNEEEKKAIEWFKSDLEMTKELGKKWGYKEEIKNNEIILNLIKKQQKEIEEWRNGIRINDNVTIPKDEIRAKIQIYKDKKADSVGMLINYEYWRTKIEVLQELLEEE